MNEHPDHSGVSPLDDLRRWNEQIKALPEPAR
jgi:hypothetical protein